jgi:hypothetical protein
MTGLFARMHKRAGGPPLLAAALLLAPGAVPAQPPPQAVPPGTPVNITVAPAAATSPTTTFVIGPRHGHVVPHRNGCTHTGGGNIDIAQPSPDTVVVTMTGVAVAYGAFQPASAVLRFDLEQCLEIVFEPKVKRAKLTVEARVIGLLRSHCTGGTASYGDACATLAAGPAEIVSLCVPPHSVSGGENLSVNDHDGPISLPIGAGKYTLHQTFAVAAAAPCCVLPCKAPSAEFAPDPALDPLWISYKEPFHGAAKKDFGFQVVLKLAEDTDNAEEKEKDVEKLPEPKTNGNGNGKGKGKEKLPPPRSEDKMSLRWRWR